MLKIYNTDIETNEFQEIREFKKGSWINLVNPSENEIKKVCENINIQEDFIRDALDYEEKARIDKEEDDNTILFVVDVPISEKGEENEKTQQKNCVADACFADGVQSVTYVIHISTGSRQQQSGRSTGG